MDTNPLIQYQQTKTKAPCCPVARRNDGSHIGIPRQFSPCWQASPIHAEHDSTALDREAQSADRPPTFKEPDTFASQPPAQTRPEEAPRKPAPPIGPARKRGRVPVTPTWVSHAVSFPFQAPPWTWRLWALADFMVHFIFFEILEEVVRQDVKP